MPWTPIITPIRKPWRPAIPWCTIDKIPTKVGKVEDHQGRTRPMGGTLGPPAEAFMEALEAAFLIVFLSTDMSRPKLRLIFFYTTRLSRYHSDVKRSFLVQKFKLMKILAQNRIWILVSKLTIFTLFEKSNFCPKIQFWQNPSIFMSFSPKFFLTIFLVKSKLNFWTKNEDFQQYGNSNIWYILCSIIEEYLCTISALKFNFEIL